MKTIAFALVVMLVGVNALPSEVETAEFKNTRIIDDLVRGVLEAVIELAKAADPYTVDSASGDYNFPVPGVFSAVASVENFRASGFGNIELDDVSFSGSSLRVEISLTGVQASVDSASAIVKIFSRTISGSISGSLAVSNVRVAVVAQLGLTGYLVDDLEVDFSVGGLESDLNIRINDWDLSDRINNWINVTLPAALEKYSEQINRLVARAVLLILGRLF
ncbi:PREDICTED: uncharacterized protein LOC106111208 [Papilio polytes]|uniref:uncharacterized protein LOC106111208 n=1 Tax=Papilio polytes TaxID=76194 RepID=UPI0006761AE4|nr:PREDICTED: uncharacterized protein LOC106111208 [Papilio polytes]